MYKWFYAQKALFLVIVICEEKETSSWHKPDVLCSFFSHTLNKNVFWGVLGKINHWFCSAVLGAIEVSSGLSKTDTLTCCQRQTQLPDIESTSRNKGDKRPTWSAWPLGARWRHTQSTLGTATSPDCKQRGRGAPMDAVAQPIFLQCQYRSSNRSPSQEGRKQARQLQDFYLKCCKHWLLD